MFNNKSVKTIAAFVDAKVSDGAHAVVVARPSRKNPGTIEVLSAHVSKTGAPLMKQMKKLYESEIRAHAIEGVYTSPEAREITGECSHLSGFHFAWVPAKIVAAREQLAAMVAEQGDHIVRIDASKCENADLIDRAKEEGGPVYDAFALAIWTVERDMNDGEPEHYKIERNLDWS
jgi:hypothetical protein